MTPFGSYGPDDTSRTTESLTMTTIAPTVPLPIVERPRMPADYGMPAHDEGLLPWGRLDERFRETRVFWVSTSGPGGRPRARPVDGLWLDHTLYVGGSPETRWVRDLEANPHVSVHLDDVHDVAILEGTAEILANGVEPELAERLAAESNRKFPEYGMKPADYIGRFAGFAIRPSTVLAWSAFPKDLTRFRFDGG